MSLEEVMEIQKKSSNDPLVESTSLTEDEKTLQSMVEIERELRALDETSKSLSFTEINEKTKEAFLNFNVCRKDIDKKIKDRKSIYKSINIESQIGAASYTVRKEICHDIGLVSVESSRAFEILSLSLFSGKKNILFSKFNQKYFYNDIKGCEEDNWTNNNVLFYSGSRFWKKSKAIMTSLEQLETEIPVDIAENIHKIKPLQLFNSFCVICDQKAVGKSSEKSLNSENTAIVLGVIEKIQNVDTGSYKSIDPQYFILGIW